MKKLFEEKIDWLENEMFEEEGILEGMRKEIRRLGKEYKERYKEYKSLKKSRDEYKCRLKIM